jgi:hypothetical protein
VVTTEHETVPASKGDVADQIDFWLAMAAGAEAWGEGRPRRAMGAHFIEALAILTAASWPVTMVASGITPGGAREALLVVLLAVAAAIMVAPLVAPGARRHYPSSPAIWGLVRIACVITGVTCGAAMLPGLALFGAWPLGVAAGLDVARTAQTLGIPIEPWKWWRRAACSAAHLGVIIGIVGVVAIGEPLVTLSRSLALYGTGILLSIVAAFTLAAAKRDAAEYSARLEARLDGLADNEFRRRGHWLHDDVCSEIRLTRLRLESGLIAPDAVTNELDELDHRLRLRQLDEFLGAREIRVAEVIQPFLRRAQQQGMVVTESPSLDTAGRRVDADTGRRLQRVLSVFVANAMQAGAGRLAVRLRWDGPLLEVEVEDDAGGFQGEALLPGRGLEVLADELGPNSITIDKGTSGARVTAHLHPSDAGHLR